MTQQKIEGMKKKTWKLLPAIQIWGFKLHSTPPPKKTCMNKQPKIQQQNHNSLLSVKSYTADTLKEITVNNDPEICALFVL